jgi:ssDNA-binding Zn-finger/Zn-ribbon topoisomerase 1
VKIIYSKGIPEPIHRTGSGKSKKSNFVNKSTFLTSLGVSKYPIYLQNQRNILKLHTENIKTVFKKPRNDSHTDTVTWKAAKKGHFHGKEQYFSGLDFIALNFKSWTFPRSGNSGH